MESPITALGAGVVAPVLLATGTLWLIWRGATVAPTPADHGLAGLDTATNRRRFIASIALPLIFAGAWLVGFGRPSLPPQTGADWILPIAMAGAVLGAAAGANARRSFSITTALWIARAGLLAFGLWLIARNRIAGGWALADAVPFIAGTAAAGLAAWWSLHRAGHEQGGLSPALVVLAVTFTSVVSVLTGHLQAAISPATLCAVAGPALLVSWNRPQISLGHALGFGAAFLSGTWFYTMVLGETPWLSNALAAASVIMIGVSGLGRLGRLRGAKAWLVRAGLVALPGLLAVAWAMLNQPASEY